MLKSRLPFNLLIDWVEEAQLRVQGLTSPEFRLHVDAVKFFTESLRSYTVEGLRHDSNNTHLHIAHGVDSSPFPEGRNDHQPPSFVSEYVQKLNEKRPLSQVGKYAGSR